MYVMSRHDTDLQEVQGPGLAPVPGEGGGAGGVDAVDPVVELHLTRGLQVEDIVLLHRI